MDEKNITYNLNFENIREIVEKFAERKISDEEVLIIVEELFNFIDWEELVKVLSSNSITSITHTKQ